MQRIAAALAAMLAASPTFGAEAPVVHAPAGAVRGQVAQGVRVFRGIPFAESPAADRRWTPPVAKARWRGVRNATAFGPACIQPRVPDTSIYADTLPGMGEDCLSLNIWAPANAAKAPVFVWIHGGSLLTGAGSLGMYDGRHMAAKGAVVVTINYRVGVFGYLAHPALSDESKQGISGNYGLQDQIAALKWVKANIAAFGGDPANVTIAGESAGALSVMYLMAAPPARGLFQRAIAQSAYMITTPALKTSAFGLPSAESVGTAVDKALGGGGLTALRAMPAEELMQRTAKAGFAPFGAVDGVYLPRQLVETFGRGEQAKVPLLAGYNAGEIRSLRVLLPPRPASEADYVARIRTGYGTLADDFLRFYPAADMEESMIAATGDAMYGWTAERLTASHAKAGQPAFLYRFDHGYPAADNANLHAFHAAEIPYVFGTIHETAPKWPPIPDTQEEQRLSDQMMEYWLAFARTGTPQAAGAPAWPGYEAARTAMVFTDRPEAMPQASGGRFALHDQVVCRRLTAGDVAWNWNVGTAAPPLSPETPACR